MNKRDALLSLLDAQKKPAYIPAEFFLHFGTSYQRGQAAIDRHLEFFRYTDMDFVKIQYEYPFPPEPAIQKPEDWAKISFHKLDFYQDVFRVVEGLVKAAKSEALVILTLYSPFMFAGQVVGEPEGVKRDTDRVIEHIHENPQAVAKGMEIITESLKLMVRECIRLGIDGFYTSTQGGEVGRLDDRQLFDIAIRPFDLALMEEANRGTLFNVLHVCDFVKPYDSLEPYKAYPGQVVSAGLDLTTGKITPKNVADIFKRPFLGGLDRKGIIATGKPAEIRKEIEDVIAQAPNRFMLGADCTVPGDTSWDNLKLAISIAHDKSNRSKQGL